MPLPRLLQFNYESTVTYNDDGFSVLSVKGMLEIPLTRDPTQATRTFTQTADDLRGEIERRVMSGINLAEYRMVRRNFSLSRDKRILSWDFQAEEKPYMDLPLGTMTARGSFNVRPAKAGMGLCTWLCTLRATYTIRADMPRRLAWFAFLALLRHRMGKSVLSNIPVNPKSPQGPKRTVGEAAGRGALISFIPGGSLFSVYDTIFNNQKKEVENTPAKDRTAMLMDFSFDEGLYLDSKTTTFSATWRLNTTFSHILLASGLWSKVEGDNRTLWATTVQEVSGAQSWLPNKAKTDIIVDFSGGQ